MSRFGHYANPDLVVVAVQLPDCPVLLRDVHDVQPAGLLRLHSHSHPHLELELQALPSWNVTRGLGMCFLADLMKHQGLACCFWELSICRSRSRRIVLTVPAPYVQE